MKPYLVDVPVSINIWIRPKCQQKQFEVIRQARPSILFVTSDGGRNEEEWSLIYQNRKIYDEEIDWNCEVYKLYENKNYGMYGINKKKENMIWSKVDRCIFLEDDQIPSESFFRFCAEMLEKYKDDFRISMICGMNTLGVYEDPSSDYFFSRYGSVWGIAMWKRTMDEFNDFSYADDSYSMRNLMLNTRRANEERKKIVGYARDKYYGGHVAATEFNMQFLPYAQHQLMIVPKLNLISNVGCTDDSAHAGELNTLPHGIRRVFNMKTYELSFPLKHPNYVMPDVFYERKMNRIMAFNHPFIECFRKLERTFLVLRYEGIGTVFVKAKQVFARKRKNTISEK